LQDIFFNHFNLHGADIKSLNTWKSQLNDTKGSWGSHYTINLELNEACYLLENGNVNDYILKLGKLVLPFEIVSEMNWHFYPWFFTTFLVSMVLISKLKMVLFNQIQNVHKSTTDSTLFSCWRSNITLRINWWKNALFVTF